MTNYNHYISISTVSMVTKHGRMVIFLDGFLLIKSHDPLIKWRRERFPPLKPHDSLIMWPTRGHATIWKNYMKVLRRMLLNLAGCWLHANAYISRHWLHVNFCDIVGSLQVISDLIFITFLIRHGSQKQRFGKKVCLY